MTETWTRLCRLLSHWLWSGNGFSTDRYKKLGLQSQLLPREVIDEAAQRQRQQLLGGSRISSKCSSTLQPGLESLRAFEAWMRRTQPGNHEPRWLPRSCEEGRAAYGTTAVATTGGPADARRFYP